MREIHPVRSDSFGCCDDRHRAKPLFNNRFFVFQKNFACMNIIRYRLAFLTANHLVENVAHTFIRLTGRNELVACVFKVSTASTCCCVQIANNLIDVCAIILQVCFEFKNDKEAASNAVLRGSITKKVFVFLLHLETCGIHFVLFKVFDSTNHRIHICLTSVGNELHIIRRCRKHLAEQADNVVLRLRREIHKVERFNFHNLAEMSIAGYDNTLIGIVNREHFLCTLDFAILDFLESFLTVDSILFLTSNSFALLFGKVLIYIVLFLFIFSKHYKLFPPFSSSSSTNSFPWLAPMP